MFLRYNELRQLVGDPKAHDARDLVSDRRDEHEEATTKRPPDWIGTATEEALAFPYAGLWGFPEKFYREPPTKAGEIVGLAASPGVIEAKARVITTSDQFDSVEDGEILVCRMTNPAWVVLFTKIFCYGVLLVAIIMFRPAGNLGVEAPRQRRASGDGSVPRPVAKEG